MTFRTSIAAPAVVAIVALGGCGGDSGTVKPVSTGATAPPAATAGPAPQTAPTSPGSVRGTAPPQGASTDTGATSEPIRVPATFIFTRPGRVDPSTVTIPPFVRVQLTLASRDGRAHALALRADGRTYTLRVAAGGRASTSIPGLRLGRYRLAPVGGGPGATLIVGGQVGP
jgi:hypothetical protein